MRTFACWCGFVTDSAAWTLRWAGISVREEFGKKRVTSPELPPFPVLVVGAIWGSKQKIHKLEADDGIKPRAKRSKPWVNVPNDTSPRMGATESRFRGRATEKPINECGSVTPVGGSDAGAVPNPGLYSATPSGGSFDPVGGSFDSFEGLFDRPSLLRRKRHEPYWSGSVTLS